MALANGPAAFPGHAGSGLRAHLGYSKLALLPGEVPRGRRMGFVRLRSNASMASKNARRERKTLATARVATSMTTVTGHRERTT